MTERETVMLNFIEYLIGYARRAAMGMIVKEDIERLARIRKHISEWNEEESNDKCH